MILWVIGLIFVLDIEAEVYEGLEDADAGRLITTEELLERIDRWAK